MKGLTGRASADTLPDYAPIPPSALGPAVNKQGYYVGRVEKNLHARTRERAAALSDLAPDAAGLVIGDLSSAAETRDLAGQVNEIGRRSVIPVR